MSPTLRKGFWGVSIYGRELQIIARTGLLNRTARIRMLPGHTRASLLGEAEVMLKITVVADGERKFSPLLGTRALIVQRDPFPLGEHSQRLCVGERISSQNGRLQSALAGGA